MKVVKIDFRHLSPADLNLHAATIAKKSNDDMDLIRDCPHLTILQDSLIEVWGGGVAVFFSSDAQES